MTTKILDTYAIIAFLQDESGADTVRNLFLKAEEGSIKLAMSVINLGEVWYTIARATSPETADRYVQEIRGVAIEIEDADWTVTRLAATYNANSNISYADCFTAALARIRKGEIVTGDKEFKLLENEIKISWL